MNLSKDDLKKIRGLIVFTLILLIGLLNYRLILDVIKRCIGIAFPFILGGALAFVLNVPMNFFERKLFQNQFMKDNKFTQKLGRPLSLLITIFAVFGVIVLVIFVVVPELAATFLALGKSIQDFIPKLQVWTEKLVNNDYVEEWIGNLIIDWESILNQAVEFFKSGASNVLGSTFRVVKRVASGITTFIIALVFSCYILLQKEKLNIQIRKVMYAYLKKEHVEKVLNVCSLTYKTFSSFLTGQCVEAIILGTMFVVCMTILKMPYALLVGVLISFTALIPIFGAFIGCIVGTFLILMVDPMQALVFLIMFLVLQQIEGNLIYPRVVGGSVGLPSIWVLSAVSIGASLMGIVGKLIFIPIVSVIYALFRANVYGHLEEKGLCIHPKFGEPIEKESSKEEEEVL